MSLTPRLDRLENNYVINGGFDIWQRGTSFTGTAIDLDYTADRWQYQEGGVTGAATVTRSTDTPSGFSGFSYDSTATTGYGASLANNALSRVRTILEGASVKLLRNKAFTVSFWVKAKRTGVLPVSVGAYANGNSFLNRYVALINVNSADTWEKKTINIPALEAAWADDNGRGLELNFNFAGGSDFNATVVNQWGAGSGDTGHSTATNFLESTNDYIRITNVMINEGSVAGEFHTAGRDFGQELALCQRYYEKSYNLESDPGGTGDGLVRFEFFGTNDTVRKFAHVYFKQPKRANPTVTTYDDTGALNVITYITSSSGAASSGESRSVFGISETGASIGSIGGGTSHRGILFYYTAESEL